MSDKIPKFPDIPQLYTMSQVAKICDRSYSHLKRLFALSIPPEPRISKTYMRDGERVRVRKWNQTEALSLRKWFERVEYGSLQWRAKASKKAARKG